MNKLEMGKALTVIMRAWNYIKVDESLIAVWHLAFEKNSVEDFMKAAVSVMKEHTGPPEMANINKTLKMMHQPEKQLTEGEAWGAVMKAVAKWGYVNEFEACKELHQIDPKIMQTVKNFGWRTICEGDASQNNTLRAQFLKAWHSLRNRQDLFEELKIQTALGPNPLTGDLYALPLDLERKFKAIGSCKDKSE